MSAVRTKHIDIIDWWHGKYVYKDGRVSDVPREDCISIFITDLGEPFCWACDKPVDNWRDLERCHILAESLGGADSPDNLFLMCPRCHIESPDTVNRGGFFRWVYRQRKNHFMGGYSLDYIVPKIDEELMMRGLPPSRDMFDRLSVPQRERFVEMMNAKDEEGKLKLLTYFQKRSTFHAGEGVSLSSKIILCVDCLIDVYNAVLTGGENLL